MALTEHSSPPSRMPAEERRKQLIEVAIDLFSKKGFGGTTTREIAAAAGVTEAIIFRHFATKQDLYTAILDFIGHSTGVGQWIAEAESFMSRNDDEGLFRCIVSKVIDSNRRDARFERLMIHAALEGHELAVMHHNQMTEAIGVRMTDYVGARQQAGALRECDPTTILFAVVGVGYFFAMHKYMHQLGGAPNLSDEQMIDSFVAILMQGLKGNTRGNQQ
ncbi:MAG TPA: TetR/AcrR family transcriptional regulator [Bryobacteraceae bacterium]|nr:TetR/AcrR family transcriptional regulator [Bryobacteraceae bacterium]